MQNFKPNNAPGDLVDDSSDDLEGMVGNAEESKVLLVMTLTLMMT